MRTIPNFTKLFNKILQGLDPIVRPSNFEENLPKSLPIDKFAEETARYKAIEVAEKFKADKVYFFQS